MPYGSEKSLDADETYIIVAYLLFLNGIVGPEATLDENSLRGSRCRIAIAFTARSYRATGVH